MEADGKSVQETCVKDVKIMVVGSKHCGKTTFIEAFAERDFNIEGKNYEIQYATLYQCKYDIIRESHTSPDGIPVKIFEIIDRGYDYDVDKLRKLFLDSNAIIFMYAIDDPLSFQEIAKKWIKILIGSDCKTDQPTILVGNKKDQREDPRLIERLKWDDQSPVTRQLGEDLGIELQLDEFFEISALDMHDQNIQEAFHYIVEKADIQRRVC